MPTRPIRPINGGGKFAHSSLCNEDEHQSRTLDWLRFPLIACVVFIHFHGPESADIPGMAGTVGGDIYDTLRGELTQTVMWRLK